MMRPNFEEPLDTAQQLLDRDITLFTFDYGDLWVQMMRESAFPAYRALGEKMIKSRDWDHFWEISRDLIIGKGTHAMMSYQLYNDMKPFGRYWRSKETVSGTYPHGGWLLYKNFHLQDVKLKIIHLYISLITYILGSL